MKSLFKAILLLSISVVVVGCTTNHRVGDFTIVSTKNVNLNSGKLALGERVKGEDKTIFGVVYMKNAVDNAIEKDRCAVALYDAVISTEVGFSTKYIAEGTLVFDRSLPGCNKKIADN